MFKSTIGPVGEAIYRVKPPLEGDQASCKLGMAFVGFSVGIPVQVRSRGATSRMNQGGTTEGLLQREKGRA